MFPNSTTDTELRLFPDAKGQGTAYYSHPQLQAIVIFKHCLRKDSLPVQGDGNSALDAKRETASQELDY